MDVQDQVNGAERSPVYAPTGGVQAVAGPPGALRVGLVVENFDPMRGGLEKWSYHFARELLEQGHEVHVLSRTFGEAARELPLVGHRVDCGTSRLTFAERAKAVAAPLGLDVVHDMGAGWYCDVFQPHGGSWASLTDRRLRMLPRWWRQIKKWINCFLPRHCQYRKLMARQYADHGQVLLALSGTVADDFQRFHRVGPERVRIVYNGVDTAAFSPERCQWRREAARRQLGIGPDTVLALVVAHNFPLKGVPTLLRAMARLSAERQPVHLAVVGGKHLDRWRRRTKRLGAHQAVTFVGPARDPLDYYAAADLYVHPTFYDTCSLVVLEAAACALPVVTSRCNGAAELFHHGHDSLLLPDPADAGQWADAIRSLLDKEFRSQLGQAARQTALRHTFQRNVDEILGVYYEVLERRSGRPRDPAIWQTRVSGDSESADTPGESRQFQRSGFTARETEPERLRQFPRPPDR